MVCGFCPGSGSAAEKSFNRADVFKRHLTSVHAVEQTPPNSRRRLRQHQQHQEALRICPRCHWQVLNLLGYILKCARLLQHLEDCVLRIVQQEEPSEAINAARLAEVSRIKQSMKPSATTLCQPQPRTSTQQMMTRRPRLVAHFPRNQALGDPERLADERAQALGSGCSGSSRRSRPHRSGEQKTVGALYIL